MAFYLVPPPPPAGPTHIYLHVQASWHRYPPLKEQPTLFFHRAVVRMLGYFTDGYYTTHYFVRHEGFLILCEMLSQQ